MLARHFCSPDVSFEMGRINQESCGRVSLAKWVKWRKGLVISIQTFEVQAGAESLTKLECGFQNPEFSTLKPTDRLLVLRKSI